MILEVSQIKKIDPRSVSLPENAKKWMDYCAQVVMNSKWDYQPLKGERAKGYGILWCETGDIWPTWPDREPERILWMSPHADDMQFAGAAALRRHVQQGDHVSELLFTGSTTGRESRGFPDDDSFTIVRLGEAILGAREVGIKRVGIIKLPSGKLGFDEWMWTADDVALRPMWIELMRMLNPHIVYSPHPDEKVDVHTDHHAVARAAMWMTGWGTENDFYAYQMPGVADNLRSWRRYANWQGTHTLQENYRVEYDPDGPISTMKQRALECFVSQFGKGYAKIAEGRAVLNGGMPNVGIMKIKAAEPFNEVKAPTVENVVFQEQPRDDMIY